MTEYRFNPDSTLSYGIWECPECGNKFFGGGKALHRDGCSKGEEGKGEEGLIYHYTPKERNLWEKEVLEKGYSAHLPLSPSELSDYLLKQSIAKGDIDPTRVREITTAYVSKYPELLPQIMEYLEILIKEATGK